MSLRRESIKQPISRLALVQPDRFQGEPAESQSKYREFFETVDDGIVAVDMAGRIVECNPAYLRLLGYDSLEELGDKTIWELTPMEYHHVKGEAYHANFELAEGAEYEQEYYHKSGGRLPITIRSWPRWDPSGRVIGAWAIVRDQSRTRLVEDEIDTMARRRLLGEVAAAINHEVRNPLTTVRGFLQFFTSDSRYPDEHKELFNLMIDELDTAVQIISDLLELVRLPGPRQDTVSLHTVIAPLMRALESMAFLRHVQITTDLVDDVRVCGDLNQLRQVILNLTQNAFEAMPESGLLHISATKHGLDAVISVTDTGDGIRPEHMPRIERPFFTTKSGRPGLGLPSCQRIISNHRGRMEMASQPGEGTTVRIYLPLAAVETGPAQG